MTKLRLDTQNKRKEKKPSQNKSKHKIYRLRIKARHGFTSRNGFAGRNGFTRHMCCFAALSCFLIVAIVVLLIVFLFRLWQAWPGGKQVSKLNVFFLFCFNFVFHEAWPKSDRRWCCLVVAQCQIVAFAFAVTYLDRRESSRGRGVCDNDAQVCRSHVAAATQLEISEFSIDESTWGEKKSYEATKQTSMSPNKQKKVLWKRHIFFFKKKTSKRNEFNVTE